MYTKTACKPSACLKKQSGRKKSRPKISFWPSLMALLLALGLAARDMAALADRPTRVSRRAALGAATAAAASVANSAAAAECVSDRCDVSKLISCPHVPGQLREALRVATKLYEDWDVLTSECSGNSCQVTSQVVRDRLSDSSGLMMLAADGTLRDPSTLSLVRESDREAYLRNAGRFESSLRYAANSARLSQFDPRLPSFPKGEYVPRGLKDESGNLLGSNLENARDFLLDATDALLVACTFIYYRRPPSGGVSATGAAIGAAPGGARGGPLPRPWGRLRGGFAPVAQAAVLPSARARARVRHDPARSRTDPARSRTDLARSRTDLALPMVSRRLCFASVALALAAGAPSAAQAAKKLSFETTATGLRWADISTGSGEAVGPASRVTFNVKGRLVGKQGWVFLDTVQEDEPYRLSMGRGEMIDGLEEGLLGMRAGGQRRLVVPSSIGYQDRQRQPVPRSFGQRQRLYTTVLNENRKSQEAVGLGDGNDVAGVVALDVEVVTVRPPAQPTAASSEQLLKLRGGLCCSAVAARGRPVAMSESLALTTSKAVIGIAAPPVACSSLYALATTGCGLRGEAGGTAEGLSYAVISLFALGSLYTRAATGSGLAEAELRAASEELGRLEAAGASEAPAALRREDGEPEGRADTGVAVRGRSAVRADVGRRPRRLRRAARPRGRAAERSPRGGRSVLELSAPTGGGRGAARWPRRLQ